MITFARSAAMLYSRDKDIQDAVDLATSPLVRVDLVTELFRLHATSSLMPLQVVLILQPGFGGDIRVSERGNMQCAIPVRNFRVLECP